MHAELEGNIMFILYHIYAVRNSQVDAYKCGLRGNMQPYLGKGCDVSLLTA